jgi:hypothetical protein
MSGSDIPITCLIRYRDVARLQLCHLCCPDTTPRVGCLCDCPICVTVTVSTYALVTFHIERVCTVQQHTPHEFLLLCELEMGELCVFLWKVKSAPSAAARARRAPYLVVCERGVCVWLVLHVCAAALSLVYL